VFSYGDDRRMSLTGSGWPNTTYAYDGRGFLSATSYLPAFEEEFDNTIPTYDSAGLLLHRYAHRAAIGFGSASDGELVADFLAFSRPVVRCHLERQQGVWAVLQCQPVVRGRAGTVYAAGSVGVRQRTGQPVWIRP
jgi:hypothetical protein